MGHYGEVDTRAVTGRRLWWLGLIGSGFGASFVVVYYLTVRTQAGRQIGDASLRGALFTRTAFAEPVGRLLDIVSVGSLMGAVAVTATVALIRMARSHGVAAIALLVGANASTWLLKEHVLVRPDLGLSEVTPATLNSMPSGHSTAAFSIVVALLVVVPASWRPRLAPVGVAYAALTALATMSAGWHRAGDSIAAFALVGLWATAAAWGVAVTAGPEGAAGQTPGRGGTRWLVVGAVGSTALGAGLILALSLVSSTHENLVGAATAFLAATLLIAGTATGATLSILAAFRMAESPG